LEEVGVDAPLLPLLEPPRFPDDAAVLLEDDESSL
jgi:hypothetical protein